MNNILLILICIATPVTFLYFISIIYCQTNRPRAVLHIGEPAVVSNSV